MTKPCPFCGTNDTDKDLIIFKGVNTFFVICLHCGAIGPTGLTEEQAIDEWNNRTHE